MAEEYEHGDDGGATADADFGALEMFDSNAPQAQFSSQAVEDGSEALIADDGLISSSKKSKKKKGSRHGTDPDSERKSNRRSARAQPETVKEEIDETLDEDVEQVVNTKKKRKLNDPGGNKGRKKRKAPGQEADDDQDNFLHKDDDNHAVNEGGEGADPADSPSEARLQRKSRSREGSAAPAETGDRMDVDEAAEMDASAQAVQNLAREAWNEHMNADLNGRGDVTEYPAPEAGQSAYEDPEGLGKEPPSSASKKTRSTRGKKAKPTFYEQPPDLEENNEDIDDVGNLPSPSAMTPKQRKRTKQSSRTSKKKKDKLSHSMRGGSDEDEDDEQSARRRNKMQGYTQGRFTDAELARIASAIEVFRTEHDMKQFEVNEVSQHVYWIFSFDNFLLTWG